MQPMALSPDSPAGKGSKGCRLDVIVPLAVSVAASASTMAVFHSTNRSLIMKKTLVALMLAFGAGSALADKPAITVVLSSPDTMTQGMAMVLANQMQAQGGQVDILLCDKAADLALKGAGGDALKPNNVTPAQLLLSRPGTTGPKKWKWRHR